MRSTLDIEELERLVATLPAGPWRVVPSHIAEGPTQLRVAEGWLLLCELPSDDWAAAIGMLRNSASVLIEAAKKLETYQRMDAEAATHVESVLCMRTDFAEIDPAESGWKGLGAALNRALDERDASEVELTRLRDTLKRAEKVIEIATSESVLFDRDEDGALERIEAARDCLAAIREAL